MTAIPPSPWQILWTTIRDATPETPGVVTFDLRFDDPEVRFAFRPGQFNMLYLPGVGEVAISISSATDDPAKLRHMVRSVGNVTQAMTHLRPGDKIGIRGPFGTAWPVDDFVGKDLVVVAGGLGLAPVRPVIYHALRHREKYNRVTLLYGARTPGDLLYEAEYEQWRAAGIDVQTIVNVGSATWHGAVGFVTAPLATLPLNPANTGVFTCGPDVMMRFVAEGAVNRGVHSGRVFVSLERNMNCAVGLCGHCQLGPQFVCKDGPVFPFDQVRRLMLVENF